MKHKKNRGCESLLDDHIYNLMMQLIEENKSLWRIKKNYQKEADCEDCRVFWKRLEKEKENNIKDLNKMIKSHMSQKDLPPNF
jgi:hypothetical protein